MSVRSFWATVALAVAPMVAPMTAATGAADCVATVDFSKENGGNL